MHSGGPKVHGNSPEDHVIPAQSGIHCVPDRKWTPAFAGVTARMIFIRSGGLQAHG